MAERRGSNDPEEILKQPLHEILARLEEDADRLYATGEIDKAVLRRLVEGKGSLGREQGERLEEALRYVQSLIGNASAARRAIQRARSGE